MSFLAGRIFIYAEVCAGFNEHSAIADERVRAARKPIMDASGNGADKAAELRRPAGNPEYRGIALRFNDEQFAGKTCKKFISERF